MKESTKKILTVVGCLYLADIIICLSWEKSRKLTKQMINKMTEMEKLQMARLAGKVNKQYTDMEDEKLNNAQQIVDHLNSLAYKPSEKTNEAIDEFKNKMTEVIKKHEQEYGPVKLDEI